MSTVKEQEKYERWNNAALHMLNSGHLGRFWRGDLEAPGFGDTEEWVGIADMLIGKLEEGKERVLELEADTRRNEEEGSQGQA
jgi:hypothetical protein